MRGRGRNRRGGRGARLNGRATRAEGAVLHLPTGSGGKASVFAVLPEVAADDALLVPLAHGDRVEGAVLRDAPEVAAAGQGLVLTRAEGRIPHRVAVDGDLLTGVADRPAHPPGLFDVKAGGRLLTGVRGAEFMDRADGLPLEIDLESFVVISDRVPVEWLKHAYREGVPGGHVELLGAGRHGLQMAPVVVEAVPLECSRRVPHHGPAVEHPHVRPEVVLREAVQPSLGLREGEPDALVPVRVVVAIVGEAVGLR